MSEMSFERDADGWFFRVWIKSMKIWSDRAGPYALRRHAKAAALARAASNQLMLRVARAESEALGLTIGPPAE